MTLVEILSDIHAVNNALIKFELRYGILSDTFFEWYQQGNEPEDSTWVLDFAEWAGWCKSRQRLLELYNQRLAELLASNGDDINHIILQTHQAVPA
ncbi:MAG: hypothetical protein ACE5F6_06665 [Anaerolineae bacterium]